MKLTGYRSVSSLLALLLTISAYGLAVVMVLTATLAVISMFVDIHGAYMDIPVSFHVDRQALPVTARSLGVQAAHIHNARGSLTFSPPRGFSIVPVALLGVSLMLGLALWGITQLRAVFRTLRDGQPFVAVNAIRIRSVGFVVIFGELARATLVFVSSSYAMTHFSANGLQFSADLGLNVFAIIHGVIILVIAEVFRAGTQLAEDQSLTI